MLIDIKQLLEPSSLVWLLLVARVAIINPPGSRRMNWTAGAIRSPSRAEIARQRWHWHRAVGHKVGGYSVSEVLEGSRMRFVVGRNCLERVCLEEGAKWTQLAVLARQGGRRKTKVFQGWAWCVASLVLITNAMEEHGRWGSTGSGLLGAPSEERCLTGGLGRDARRNLGIKYQYFGREVHFRFRRRAVGRRWLAQIR
jgi:hypothetical protein